MKPILLLRNEDGQFQEATVDNVTGKLIPTEIVVDPRGLHHFGSQIHSETYFADVSPPETLKRFYESAIGKANGLADYAFLEMPSSHPGPNPPADIKFRKFESILTLYLK